MTLYLDNQWVVATFLVVVEAVPNCEIVVHSHAFGQLYLSHTHEHHLYPIRGCVLILIDLLPSKLDAEFVAGRVAFTC